MTARLLPLLPGLLGIGICHAELHFQIAPAHHPRPDHVTLDEAMESLAKLRRTGRTEAATFSFRSGLYSFGTVIDPELAGEGLRFESADPESEFPCISSGSLIRNWTLEDGIWTTVLADEPSGLFVDAKRCPRARTPNDGYWRIGKSGPDRRTSFTWKEDTIPPVRDLAHLDLVFLHDWSISRIPVASLDAAPRTLTTKFPIGPEAAHYKIDHYEPHPRFFLEGSRDFLDAPGEWHYDRSNKTLRYMPRPGEDPKSTRIMAAGRSPALVLRGTAAKPLRNVRFSAISFWYAGWLPPGGRYAAGQASFHEDGTSHTRTPVPCAVEADFCEELSFAFCRFGYSTGGGLWIRRQCRDVKIESCTFHTLGANGLMIGEPMERESVTSGVTVEKCTITGCGQRYFGSVGIWIGMAADCTVRDNVIRDLPYTGISLGWRWNPTPSPCKGHLIESNHIHHVLLTLSDGGGIYTLGRQPGSVLRGNHIHDVRVNAGRAESNGIFMDEGSTDFLVEGNDIHDIARSPIRFHRAGKNVLRDNKLRPGKEIPPLRFNRTAEDDITVERPR